MPWGRPNTGRPIGRPGVGRPKGVSLWPLNCPLITIHLAFPWSWNLPYTPIQRHVTKCQFWPVDPPTQENLTRALTRHDILFSMLTKTAKRQKATIAAQHVVDEKIFFSETHLKSTWWPNPTWSTTYSCLNSDKNLEKKSLNCFLPWAETTVYQKNSKKSWGNWSWILEQYRLVKEGRGLGWGVVGKVHERMARGGHGLPKVPPGLPF
jgi:hypothetical protein